MSRAVDVWAAEGGIRVGAYKKNDLRLGGGSVFQRAWGPNPSFKLPCLEGRMGSVGERAGTEEWVRAPAPEMLTW